MDNIAEPNNDKKINIIGTNNRYQVKKLLKLPPVIKKKKNVEQLPDNYYLIENQLDILERLTELELYATIKSLIDKKISSYKQQDIEKDKYDVDKFVTFDNVIGKMNESGLNCYYCSCKMFLLYEIVREMKQWTLDRVDNDLGHNNDNVIISCLECNLKRRRTNKDSFLFTKNLTIVKN
uniref:Uncharacterized protein n=1 Tax=viral metagenome TaxID=1070528 RepID=A0A6C0HX73_9ZZZZ